MSDIIDGLMAGNMAKRSADGIASLAAQLGCETAVALAIVEVESNGKGYDSAGRVKVLFEKHKFYKNLPAEKRQKAVKAGLARKKWIKPADGGYKDQPNNGAALDLLCRAIKLDEAAALKSASYGIGQVLGENYAVCGWRSVQAFVADMCASEDNHVKAMLGFLKGNGLADSLRDRDFNAVARIYNGTGQVSLYGEKMRIAYAKHAGKSPLIGSQVRASGLRLGSAGYRVEALQKRLNEIGFPVKVDSDFGTSTRRAVLAFQAENGLDVDGVVGPATQAALDTAEAKIPETRRNATLADLRADGSTIVKGADGSQVVAGLTIAGASAGAADKAGLFDNLERLSETVRAVSAPVTSLVELAAGNWWLIAAAAGFALFWYARNIKKSRLAGYQAGRII
ncbi:putative membrane protein [Brucella sp. 10RB9215]|uniref:N-acetylmuramidase domain-containing protein n=1 Tax=Brucella sp. 10RB9215 TaxID=1149953 RepID=UPI00090C28CC|nr:N-acetylmuramidase domain-containing protein [Brucella sp. 10RB9215]SBW15281.1 putative membrane protein [Brucella sp. 10RB9215]